MARLLEGPILTVALEQLLSPACRSVSVAALRVGRSPRLGGLRSLADGRARGGCGVWLVLYRGCGRGGVGSGGRARLRRSK